MSNATRNLQPEEQGEVTVGEVRPFPAEEDLMELLNRGYVCPAEAGPAWRAAYVAGVDMGLIEDAMRMSPGERLREHQRALNLVLAMVQARSSYDSGS